MKTQRVNHFLIVFVLMFFGKAFAADSLEVTDAFANPTFKLAMNGAAYVSLKNISSEVVAITGLSVSEDVAKKAELHETYLDNEMARMRQLQFPVTIAPYETLMMQQGGKHVMLMGLARPLTEGQTLTIEFQFADGGTQAVTLTIGGEAEEMDHSHHH